MNKLHNQLGMMVGMMHSQKGRLVVLLLTVALFVLAAAAPNCTIGIGK